MTLKDLGKIVGDQRKALGLWPQGDDGNGNGHGHHKDYDKLARELYEDHREHWYFHDSSWCARGLNKYDEQGCNQFTGCIPECVYADGRLDLSELERIKNEIKHADVKGTEAEDDSNNISPMSDKTRLE